MERLAKGLWEQEKGTVMIVLMGAWLVKVGQGSSRLYSPMRAVQILLLLTEQTFLAAADILLARAVLLRRPPSLKDLSLPPSILLFP